MHLDLVGRTQNVHDESEGRSGSPVQTSNDAWSPTR